MESFRVLKKIGQGGFGRAYVVKSLESGELRVVKQVKLKNLSQRAIEKTMDEIKIMSKLKHFNIIHYRSHVVQNDSLMILMDYADGGDISTLIQGRNGRPWSEDIIIDYFVQMCLAVKYLHDRKIIHRDIKASNFFLCKNGIIKLGDFGLSRLLPSTKAMLETQIGSPYYLSPEVCKGEEYNTKTDIWSLGIVLYEMCALKHPFIGRTTKEVMENIVKSKSPMIPKYYDLDLQKIVRMMLEKDPEKRPNINDIFSLPLIKYKSIALLGQTQARIELSHTIFHGCKPGVTPDDFPDEILFVDDYNELSNEIKSSIICDGQLKKDDKSDSSDKKSENNVFISYDSSSSSNKNDYSDDFELVDFMGIPMRLPHARKSSPPNVKADDLREFIECLVGKEKIEEIYTFLKKSKKNPATLQFKFPYKKEICIVKLVERLIQYENQAICNDSNQT